MRKKATANVSKKKDASGTPNLLSPRKTRSSSKAQAGAAGVQDTITSPHSSPEPEEEPAIATSKSLSELAAAYTDKDKGENPLSTNVSGASLSVPVGQFQFGAIAGYVPAFSYNIGGTTTVLPKSTTTPPPPADKPVADHTLTPPPKNATDRMPPPLADNTAVPPPTDKLMDRALMPPLANKPALPPADKPVDRALMPPPANKPALPPPADKAATPPPADKPMDRALTPPPTDKPTPPLLADKPTVPPPADKPVNRALMPPPADKPALPPLADTDRTFTPPPSNKPTPADKPWTTLSRRPPPINPHRPHWLTQTARSRPLPPINPRRPCWLTSPPCCHQPINQWTTHSRHPPPINLRCPHWLTRTSRPLPPINPCRPRRLTSPPRRHQLTSPRASHVHAPPPDNTDRARTPPPDNTNHDCAPPPQADKPMADASRLEDLGPDANSHRGHKTNAPQQPTPQLRKKATVPEKGTPEWNSWQEQRRLNKEAWDEKLKGYHEVLLALEAEFLNRAEQISADYDIPIEEVELAMHVVTKFKGRRCKPNLYNAKVWRKRIDLMLSELRALVAVDDKECPMTPEEEQTLLVEFVESRLSKAEGTRRTNADCAKDVTYMADRIQDEVCMIMRLSKQTGAYIICLIGWSNHTDTFTPCCLHSEGADEYIRDRMNMTTQKLAINFDGWGVQDHDLMAGKHLDRRKRAGKMIEKALIEGSGVATATMKYKNFDQKVALEYNVKLVGWDKDRIPFVANISKPKLLAELLLARMTPEERAIVEARVAAEPSKRAPCKDIGKKHVKVVPMDDDDDENNEDEDNEDEDEDEPAPKKGTKRRHDAEELEGSGVEPAAKKAKGPKGAPASGKPKKPRTEQEKKAACNTKDRERRARAKAAKTGEGKGGSKRKAKSNEFINDDSDTPPPAKKSKRHTNSADDNDHIQAMNAATACALAELRRKRKLIGASGSSTKGKATGKATIAGHPGRPPGRRSFPPMPKPSSSHDADDSDAKDKDEDIDSGTPSPTEVRAPNAWNIFYSKYSAQWKRDNPGRESYVVAGLAAMWAMSPENPNRLFSTPLIFDRTEAPPADTTKRDRVIVSQLTPLRTQPRASESQPAAYTRPHTYVHPPPAVTDVSALLFRPRAPFNYASHALPYALPPPPVVACALPALQAALPVPSVQDEATFAYLGRSHALHLLAETHGVSAGRAAQVYAHVRDLRTADVALREAREFEQGSFEARMRALEYHEEDDAPTVHFAAYSALWAGHPAPSAGYRTPSAPLDARPAVITLREPRTLSVIDGDASKASFTPAKSKRKRDDDSDPDIRQREADARRFARKRRKQARADANALAHAQPRTVDTAETAPAPATLPKKKYQEMKEVNEPAQTPIPVKEKRKKKKHDATLTGVDAVVKTDGLR
ncbi:hypothetical protein C8J57DRAFT_1534357 [Mycena rebaudengoi]|nr:hypothetical protein C8J57DRAFT_1534357 [Mycena rebaudengoi]